MATMPGTWTSRCFTNNPAPLRSADDALVFGERLLTITVADHQGGFSATSSSGGEACRR